MHAQLPRLLMICCLSTSARAADWPSWRGPTGMGHAVEKNLPLTWNAKTGENIRWKVLLPGQEANTVQDQNQSSPIVHGDRVFITASYWRGKPSGQQFPEHHVACYQADDGKLLWDVKVDPGPWLLSDLRGGYTAPTPAADAERIYVIFGSAVIAALDREGKQVWRKEIKPHKFDVALAASPVLFGGTLILQCDQLDKQSRLLAFNRKDGEIVWEQLRPTVGFSHSTPTLLEIGGKQQLLVSGSNALQGVDPANGKVLWSCAASGDTVSPVLGKGLIYIDSGRGGAGIAVDPTGSGDVTKTHIKWKVPQLPEGFSSPVVVGDYLYRQHAPDVLKCVNLANGAIVYAERLPGVSTSTSPIATANGLLYLVSAGKSCIVKPGPKFELLATNELGDGSHASAAVSNGRLFLKGRKMLYCVANKE